MASDSGNNDFWRHGASGGPGIPGVRRSPSGRIPQWAIDEALGKLQDPDPWRGEPVSRKPVKSRARKPRALRPRGLHPREIRPLRPARRRAWKTRSGTVLGIALVVGLYFTPSLFERFVLPAALPYLPGAKMPPPGFEAAAQPLGTPAATNGSTAYVLQESPDPGQALVAYDPCRPLHYVVRPDNAPPGTDLLIQQAVAAVSDASGLRFVYDGSTSEAPSDPRATFQPERYGKQWAPILIVWSTPEESPALAGRVAGIGGSAYAHTPGEPFVYVAGQVRLDAPALAEIMSWPDGAASVRAIIMHELGHVLGLDHVNDPTQLMFEENSGLTGLGDGDRAGLAVLGRGECVPQL